jgi:hypothetical protein
LSISASEKHKPKKSCSLSTVNYLGFALIAVNSIANVVVAVKKVNCKARKRYMLSQNRH